MARQSILMIVLALAGSLVFLFVVMPQVVQLFFRFFGSGDTNFGQEDTIPPQVPIVTLPPPATSKTSLDLEGFGEADSLVVVVHNGREIDQVEVDNEGQFSYTLELDKGENLVSLYGVDQAGNESATRQLVIVQDSEAPTLLFEDLDEGKQIVGRDQQNFSVRGETEPESQLTLNDRSVFVRSDGTFTAQIYLQEGDNTLKFVVIDQAGNRTEREVRVTFRY
jgi:hypothetical protein